MYIYTDVSMYIAIYTENLSTKLVIYYAYVHMHKLQKHYIYA